MKSCPSCDAPNGQSCRKGCPEYIHPRNHMAPEAGDFIYNDIYGTTWRLVPTHDPEMPLIITKLELGW